jgi:ArsR family transcriptional regulator, lead/cadmium/zinc/bismuth-responsive transcriptional repressor
MGSRYNDIYCRVRVIHEEAVNRVRQLMHELAYKDELADFFKLFGDGTRISILWALSKSEMCVCDLCALLEMKQSAISHQLKKLRQARIIKSRRDGKIIYYSLDDDHIERVLNIGMAHIREEDSGE